MFKRGPMKQGWGTCSKSFQVISANVPCTYYIHKDIYELWYVHVPRCVLGTYPHFLLLFLDLLCMYVCIFTLPRNARPRYFILRHKRVALYFQRDIRFYTTIFIYERGPHTELPWLLLPKVPGVFVHQSIYSIQNNVLMKITLTLREICVQQISCSQHDMTTYCFTLS